ncbi:EXTL2-like UDP-GlcNAc:heparan alpha-N-acetylhexosaminyltransferase [Pseudohyphozyma bogoriensis]|nr:EXTL2-like UDP-GlcNAc:heparan alpha-N-acetylhexosaminyltransferase [Pseudohyphozyma bogoriensis]
MVNLAPSSLFSRLWLVLVIVLPLLVEAQSYNPLAAAMAPRERPKRQPTYSGKVEPINMNEGFTMLIATYNRTHLLEPLLSHLTTTPPPSLKHILIIWQNVGVPLPPFLNHTTLRTRYADASVKVSVRISKVNSMNERFRPQLDWSEDIETEAVMIMDDDVVLRRDALEWGYQEFRKVTPLGGDFKTGRIVGFTGRDVNQVDGEWKYVVQPRREYSMVLSNAAWLRKDWLRVYWNRQEEVTGLRNYVDEVFNCDDLLINFLVSNWTHTPPLLLQPHTPLRTIPGTGLWTRAASSSDHTASLPVGKNVPTSTPSKVGDSKKPKLDHFTQRKHCLAKFLDHFGAFAVSVNSTSPHYPLVKTSIAVTETGSETTDVVDHARWMFPGEGWEETDFKPPAEMYPAEEFTDETMDGDDVEYWDREIDDMTDEEVDAFLKALNDEAEKERVERERRGSGGGGGFPVGLETLRMTSEERDKYIEELERETEGMSDEEIERHLEWKTEVFMKREREELEAKEKGKGRGVGKAGGEL